MTMRMYWDAEKQIIVKERMTTTPPKKLSKSGIWRKNNPDGLGVEILDMRAVLR